MKKIGVVSYNIHANFTNYGSALQSWALCKAISKLGYNPILIDYCPDILADKTPLDPFKHSWDRDENMAKMIESSMPAIEENYAKFERFYTNRFNRSKPYTRLNFASSNEEAESYVCGSDTIFSPDEFDLDDGFFANYDCMRLNSISYAASFGDPHFSEEQLSRLDKLIKNFKALGIRENLMIPYLKSKTTIEVKRVIDPTLLLNESEYETITSDMRLVDEKYILYYSRRYNPVMEKYVEKLAEEKKWKIVEISLRAQNELKGHIMYYRAGVEEFLSLVKHSEYVVTNSFHGMIFSVQFKKNFSIFSRSLCDNKIIELLDLFGLPDRLMVTGEEKMKDINYSLVFKNIEKVRKESISFLKRNLSLL